MIIYMYYLLWICIQLTTTTAISNNKLRRWLTAHRLRAISGLKEIQRLVRDIYYLFWNKTARWQIEFNFFCFLIADKYDVNLTSCTCRLLVMKTNAGWLLSNFIKSDLEYVTHLIMRFIYLNFCDGCHL